MTPDQTRRLVDAWYCSSVVKDGPLFLRVEGGVYAEVLDVFEFDSMVLVRLEGRGLLAARDLDARDFRLFVEQDWESPGFESWVSYEREYRARDSAEPVDVTDGACRSIGQDAGL